MTVMSSNCCPILFVFMRMYCTLALQGFLSCWCLVEVCIGREQMQNWVELCGPAEALCYSLWWVLAYLPFSLSILSLMLWWWSIATLRPYVLRVSGSCGSFENFVRISSTDCVWWCVCTAFLFRRDLRALNARLKKQREPRDFQRTVVDWQRLELDSMKPLDREYCKSAAVTYYSSSSGAAKASKYMSQAL